MDMPSPVPFWESLLRLRSCVKASKTCSANSLVIPQPVSAIDTVSTASFPDAYTASCTFMVMRPPSGVNFTAFDRMFMRTCDRRTSSPRSHGCSTVRDSSKRIPRSAMGPRCISQTLSTSAFTSKGSLVKSTLPACSFDMSRMSFTSDSRYWAALPSRFT